MKLKTVQWILAILLLTSSAQAQSIWDTAHLAKVRQSISRRFYKTAYIALKKEADSILCFRPLSVMMKEKTPASGNKHDYMSQARYYWPDSTKPNGLPYINRDGISNPELDKLDRNTLGMTANRITTLILAWYFSGDEKYAQKAVELIRVWFLDKATRMNPNLEYAQMIPGQNNDKGRCYGLIDTYSFVEMLDAIALLEQSNAITVTDSRHLKSWFSQLTEWMLTSQQGKEEAAGANNHSVAFDAQIIAFSLYTGDKKLAKKIIEAFPEKRIFLQIEPDGRQIHELQRTLAFHYSQYNLEHFIDIMLMAKKLCRKIDNVTSADGRNFYKAMDFLASYLEKNKSEWAYQQISGWESTLQNFCKDLYRTAVYLNPARKDYLRLYYAHRVFEPQDRFNLLYVQEDTETENEPL